MAIAASGIRRTMALVSAMSVVALTPPAAVQAEPPPHPPSPDVLIAEDLLGNTSTPAERDDGYRLGVALLGLKAWVEVTSQRR